MHNRVTSDKSTQHRFVLGILGMPGSGKSEIARFLRNCGFPVIRLGDFIEIEVKRQGMSPGPSSEAIVRTSLRDEFGTDVLARKVLDGLSENESTLLFVLDGVYSPDEDNLLRVELSTSYFTIATLCDRVIRYNRLENRDHRHLKHSEALKRDMQEMQVLRKADTIVMADHFVVNNSDVRSLLEASFDKIVQHVVDMDVNELSSLIKAPVEELISFIDEGRGTHDQELWILIARAQLTEDPVLAWYVCRLIGDSAYQEGIYYLLFVGQKDDIEFDRSSLHRIAAQSLGKLGSDSSSVVPFLTAESWSTRQFAADALGEIGDPQVLGDLFHCLSDEPSDEVIKWIALSIAKLSKGVWRDSSIERLVKVIGESGGKRQLWAIDCLARIDLQLARRSLQMVPNSNLDGDVEKLRSELVSLYMTGEE